VTLCCCAPAPAEEPFADQLLVFAAQPKKTIEHGVEWKGPFDPRRRETMLIGPTHYAATVRRDLQTTAANPVFNWYQIKDPPESLPTRVKVWVDSADDAPRDFQLGAPAYFLSTTQRISEGTPASVPEGLSHFVAYRVLNGEASQREVTPAADSKTPDVSAAFFCIPVEEWHHHQHFPVENRATCLVVYTTETTKSADPKVTTLDQFGLHTLQLEPAAWLCVPGKEFRIETGER
jgi:hypothetical protein